jgi:hypothetical protein
MLNAAVLKYELILLFCGSKFITKMIIQLKHFVMKKRLITMMFVFALPLIVLATAISSRAKVTVQNPATSDGMITIRFQPRGGVATDVTVKVRKGWSPLQISSEIAHKLTAAMPRNYRATSRTHGTINYVDVEKDVSSAANFSVSIVNMTFEGTSVDVIEAN